VEGRVSPTLSHNHSHYRIDVVEHVTRRDTQHRKAHPLQIDLAQRIDTCPIREFMSASVNLNEQACRKACEVGDVTADGVLASEFQT
jgi:hypothetical protein